MSPCSFPWHALCQVLFQGLQFEGVKKHPLNTPPKKTKNEMLKQVQHDTAEMLKQVQHDTAEILKQELA